MLRGSARLPLAAIVCSLPLAIFGWQNLDSDEVRTRSGPYLPRSLAASFTTDSKLVEIPAVVRDSHSHAVDGLRQEDFEVFDLGKKRAITSFSVQNNFRAEGSASSAAVPPVAGYPATDRAKKSEPRFVALVFDDENAGFDNITSDGLIRAVDAGTKFVRESLSPDDRAAVFSLSLGPVSPLTNDPSKLVAAMKGLRLRRRIPPSIPLTGCLNPYGAYLATVVGGKGARPPAQVRTMPGGRPSAPASAAQTQSAQARALWAEVRSNSRRLLEMFADIVDFMSRLPGQRLVLVASPGFQTGTLEAETADLIDRAVRAGVVFNTMDVTGLWGGPTGADCSPGSVLGVQMQESAVGVLSNLASGTGGQFFHNNNDLLRGFRDLDASEVSYRLGFVPEGSADGRFHRVKVRVTSENNYAVQARPGYFDPAPGADKNGTERKIDRAVLGSDSKKEIPVAITTTIDRENELPSVWAVAHVDLANTRFQKVDGRRVNDLTMVAALFDPQGNFVTGKEGGISFSLKDSSFATLSKEGVNCTLTLMAPPGSYRLRTVVTDASGKMVASNDAVELR